MSKKAITLQQLETALQDFTRWLREKLTGYVPEPAAEGKSGWVLTTNGAGGRSWERPEAAAEVWRPAVSAEGVLSWEKSSEDEVPASVNIKGPQGEKGETGAAGAAGPQGPQGEKGETGATGPKGDTGATGPKGDTGATGPKGDKGDTGAAGPKGDKGDTGPQGEKGDTGATGSQGEKGDKGDAGENGYTPVKGTDYWTAADKSAMVSDVLAALPTWTGGSY